MRKVPLVSLGLALVVAACGGQDEGKPRHETLTGELVQGDPTWPVRSLGLRTSRYGFVFLLDRETGRPIEPGALEGFEQGDRVQVEGVFNRYSTLMRGVIRVESIESG